MFTHTSVRRFNRLFRILCLAAIMLAGVTVKGNARQTARYKVFFNSVEYNGAWGKILYFTQTTDWVIPETDAIGKISEGRTLIDMLHSNRGYVHEYQDNVTYYIVTPQGELKTRLVLNLASLVGKRTQALREVTKDNKTLLRITFWVEKF